MAGTEDVIPLVAFTRKASLRLNKLLTKASHNNRFRRSYAVGSFVVLLGTTLLWAMLGARLQSHNADQLSDPYMFSNWATFHGATFPGSHSFLLKWPIFWLISIIGVSTTSLLWTTVAVVMVTVVAVVAIIYKIDRRPLVFGTICLGLSLALLLIPAQPYAGGILPVNMAMLTTRNLEYAVYLAVLVLFVRAKRIRTTGFIVGMVLLAILIASDKLFLSLSAGGALLAMVVYVLVNNWSLATFAARWLVGSLVAGAGALVILYTITATHLTHLTNSAAATPYGVIHSGKNLVLGVVYAILGLFTNVGANPAYGNRVIAQFPSDLFHHLWSLGGLAYLAAAAGFVYSLVLVWRNVRPTLRSTPRRTRFAAAHLLSLSLIWSTVAALGVFIATIHYYAVDARYLTIGLFALVVTVSVELRRREWRWPADLLVISGPLLVAIALAVFTALHISNQQTTALSGLGERNSVVMAALEHHKVDVLVGDYWRVLPIKLASHGSINALPLTSCTGPAEALTSSVWQPNLTNHSFAYLVTLDGSLTDFPNCSLTEITAKYGRPNATQVIAGTISKPAEALLFYDHGSHVSLSQDKASTVNPLLPVTTSQLVGASCDVPTIMNVVAHEDDDILFMNPDLDHDIQAGHCIRTVFLTAGDGGGSKLYWLGRQLGAMAAYNSMLGHDYVWEQTTVKLAKNEYITVVSPQGDTKISLIFFNLPDGDLQGQGFASSGFQSLAKLKAGTISSIHSVDGESQYTVSQLTTALAQLMTVYNPAQIRTQADVASAIYPDHSDHINTGKLTELAAQEYDQSEYEGSIAIPVTRYIGYPIHGYPSNVSGSDLAQKEATFLAYANYDPGVCSTVAQCAATPTYGTYLTRQYTEDPSQP